MATTPTFYNPPVVELVLGVQFSPLVKLTAGHFGLLWNELGEDWIEPRDGLSLPEEFERFEQHRFETLDNLHFRLEPLRLPGRFMLGHRTKDRLVQVQGTRFHLNWRKHNDFYPSYKNLIGEFEQTFAKFESFVKNSELGMLALNQWELSYVDSFPKEEYWQTPADWPRVLPGLFGGELFPTENLGISLEQRGAEWMYEIQPKRGRLRISAHLRAIDDKQESLVLTMTARGPIGKGGVDKFRTGLDLGHDIAVASFLRSVNPDLQRKWETKS